MPGRYLTVDELTSCAAALAAAHPDRAVLRRIGSSKAGEPIRLLSVGRGGRHVLVVAGPHANEPVGGVTALRLARYVARSMARGGRPGRPGRSADGDGSVDTDTPTSTRAHNHADGRVNGRAGSCVNGHTAKHPARDVNRFADTTWHFVLCLDPDGARRNERWINGPMTFAHHYRHFFRPGFARQPEWLPTEPGAEPMPETRALLDLQDELRPYLQCSLHGVDVGGSFVQLTRGLPGLSDRLARSAADHRIPVERGPYDAFFWPSPGPGVYDMPRAQEADQFLSLPAATAASTWFHPHAYGTVTAVIEAPMWGVAEVGDTSPHPDPHGALETISRTLRQDARLLDGLLERVLPGMSAAAASLLAPVQEYLAVCPGLADEWAPEGPLGEAGGLEAGDLPLNRARIMALRIAAQRLVVRTAGLMDQMLDAGSGPAGGGRAAGDADADVHDVRVTLDRFLTQRCEMFEAGCRARWIPVHDQVEHQFRVVLAASDLATRFGEPSSVQV